MLRLCVACYQKHPSVRVQTVHQRAALSVQRVTCVCRYWLSCQQQLWASWHLCEGIKENF